MNMLRKCKKPYNTAMAEPLSLLLTIVFLLNPSLSAEAHFEDPSEKPKEVHKHQIKTAPRKGKDLLMPSAEASVSSTRIFVEGNYRIVQSDGLPDEPYGQFPNRGNPNAISPQNHYFRIPLHPVRLGSPVSQRQASFGVGLDGVPFDPGTAEYWNHDPSSGWHIEALNAPGKLGVDLNNAHVQPNGAYHYHGIPTSLMKKLSRGNSPVLLGYAADGYPIYGPFGFSESKQGGSSGMLKSSYRLRTGLRPGGLTSPRGVYDGTFTQDYEYVEGLGDLDECNGRSGSTPEYPQGTYYYVLTQNYPFIPRSWHGEPDPSFFKGPPGGRRGANGGPPGGRRGRQGGVQEF